MLPANSLKGRAAIIPGDGTGIGPCHRSSIGESGRKPGAASRNAEHLEPAARELRSKFANSGTQVIAAFSQTRVRNRSTLGPRPLQEKRGS